MRQTLFFIPSELANVTVFGIGWVLLLWVGGCLLTLFWNVKKHGWTDDTKSFLPFIAIVGAVISFVLPMVQVAVPESQQDLLLWQYSLEDSEQATGLPIRGYGVFLLIATISGLGLAMFRAKKVGLSSDAIFNLAFHMFAGGILGARVFYIVQKWDSIHDPNSPLQTLFNMVNFVEGGLVVYGSLMGALVAGGWYLLRNKLPVLAIADLIAPSLALGLAIGRLGCLMNGCCYGGPCDHAFGLEFPRESPPYFDQHRSGLFYGFQLQANASEQPVIGSVEADGSAAASGLPVGAIVTAIGGNRTETLEIAQYWLGNTNGELAITTDQGEFHWSIGELPKRTQPIHPTQIYSSANALLMCIVTLAVFPYRRRDGQVFALLIGMYAITRFMLEVIRTDEPGIWGTGMTISQNVSVGMLIGAALLIAYIAKQPRGSIWPQPAA